jgi:hypothetical protein
LSTRGGDSKLSTIARDFFWWMIKDITPRKSGPR